MSATNTSKMTILASAARRALEVQGVDRMHVRDIARMFAKAGQRIPLTDAEFAQVLEAGGLDVRGLWVHAS